MNTHELLEMASLDALGLLDPEERESFERAFRAAPPAVQAQIRREQVRFSHMDDVLPQVEPPLGLRARVIAAVREAMQSMASRRAAEAAPALRFPTGVSRFWRVGAIGAMAAALVLGFFAMSVYSDNAELTDLKLGVAVDEQLAKEFGRRFGSTFLNANTHFVSFTTAADAPDTKGARPRIMFDPANKRAELYVQDLPSPGGLYEVVVVDAKGNEAPAVLQFTAPAAGIKFESIKDIDLKDGSQLLIRLQNTTKPVLTSQDI